MEESVTYQAIIERGEIMEARRLLLAIGRKKFSPPDAATQAAVAATADRERLEHLHERVFDVASWRELLEPKAGARPRRPRQDVPSNSLAIRSR
jgi:hypothetical protein